MGISNLASNHRFFCHVFQLISVLRRRRSSRSSSSNRGSSNTPTRPDLAGQHQYDWQYGARQLVILSPIGRLRFRTEVCTSTSECCSTSGRNWWQSGASGRRQHDEETKETIPNQRFAPRCCGQLQLLTSTSRVTLLLRFVRASGAPDSSSLS